MKKIEKTATFVRRDLLAAFLYLSFTSSAPSDGISFSLDSECSGFWGSWLMFSGTSAYCHLFQTLQMVVKSLLANYICLYAVSKIHLCNISLWTIFTVFLINYCKIKNAIICKVSWVRCRYTWAMSKEFSGVLCPGEFSLPGLVMFATMSETWNKPIYVHFSNSHIDIWDFWPIDMCSLTLLLVSFWCASQRVAFKRQCNMDSWSHSSHHNSNSKLQSFPSTKT